MKNLESNSKRCISYAPGHNVHWIQARVKHNEPRYDADVEVLTETTLRVRYLDQVETFHHHNAPIIQANLKKAVLNYIRFSPSSSLLYIQTEKPNGEHGGSFSLHYLCDQELFECVIDQYPADL